MSSLSSEEMSAQRSDFGLRLSNSMAQYGPLCVGIDPHRQLLTDWGYNVDALGAELYSMRMLQAANGRAAAVKFQFSMFERYGSKGIALLPYYGARSLGGVINDALNNGRGVFIASLTSNQEGASLQTAIRQAGEYKGRTVAYGIASTAQKFNKGNDGMGSVGLIIGATIGQWINDSGVDPAKFTGPILSPGYGWQGAETRDLKTVFKGTKGNVLVTVSRFIATHGPDISSLAAATESVALDIRQALIEAQNEVDDEILDDEEDE